MNELKMNYSADTVDAMRNRLGQNNGHEFTIKGLINILLIMFIICESMMNMIIVSILPINNLLGYAMLLIGIMALIVQHIEIDFRIVCIVFFCLISFYISGIKGEIASYLLYLIHFMSFGMIGIVAARVRVAPIRIFKATLVVSEIFILLNLTKVVMIESDFNFGYAIIPGVLSSIFLIFNNWKIKRYRNMLFYSIFSIPIFIMFIFRCSRGNLVQVGIFLLLGAFFLSHYRKLTAIFTGVVIIMFLNLREIIAFLNEWANTHGLVISFIWKTHYLLNTHGQSLLHGREELFTIVKQNSDWKTFFFGNGIGDYEYITGTYPHNIFLSAFCDFGIIGIGFMIVLVWRVIGVLKCSRNVIDMPQKELILMIFILSFVKLCFSGVYWNSSTFWYLVSYLF